MKKTLRNSRASKRLSLQTKCCVDTDLRATFSCAKCHRPFCEKCVGHEEGLQVFCLECSIFQLNKPAKKEGKSLFSRLPIKKVFGVLASLLLCLNLYIIITGKESKVSIIKQAPPMSVEISNLVECRNRLEAVATLANDYKNAMDTLPDSIEDLFSLAEHKELLYDPISHQQYIIKNTKGAFSVSCPSPEAYGLSALFATIGKPAQMEFAR